MKILFVDPSTGLETPDDLKRKGRGGMVSSLVILTNALSKSNKEVRVLSDIKQEFQTSDGVLWYARGDWPKAEREQWDFIVFNRCTYNGFPELKAKHRILWTHDCVHGGWIPNPRTMKAFSATVFMSKYSERCWRYFYSDIGKSFLIPNGVDKSLFYPRQKDMNYLIFASAPNRGIARLPLFYEALRNKINQSLYLKVFGDMKTMHPFDCKDKSKHTDEIEEHNDGWEDLYNSHYKALEDAGIERAGAVPQAVLAEEMGKAALLLMPSGYPEQCSNVVLQSLASGTPVITTGIGGNVEWVKHKWNGMVTQFHLEDYMAYHREFYNHCREVLTNRDLHLNLIKNAPETKNLFTWEEIGRCWSNLFDRLY